MPKIIKTQLCTVRGKLQSGGMSAPASVVSVAAIAGVLAIAEPPHAESAPIKIYSPGVVKGRNDIEYLGFRDFDKDEELDGAERHSVGMARGLTDYWLSELSLLYAKASAASLEYESAEWENLFRLSRKDQYWADFGLFTQYELTDHGPDEILIAPIVQKDIDRWEGTLNVFFGRQVGNEAEPGTTLSYGARLKYQLREHMAGALEAFGEVGRIGHFGSFNDQEHWAGPAFYGELKRGRANKLVYSAAYLFRMSSASSDNRLIARVEYEFF